MEKVTVCCDKKVPGFRRWLSFDAHGTGAAEVHGSYDYYEYVIPEEMLAIALVRGAWLKGGERR